MKTIDCLKELAAAIKGSGQADDIPGNTVPEVIQQITKAYTESKSNEEQKET